METGVSEAKFYGHTLSADGLKPDPNKIMAVDQLPARTCKKELETVMGMKNYRTKFTPGLAKATVPIRKLLKDETAWCWKG